MNNILFKGMIILKYLHNRLVLLKFVFFLDKGENIWDRFTHQEKSPILDGTNADVTCDSYHKYKEDVDLVRHIGVSEIKFLYI